MSSVGVMFFIELLVPFVILVPPRLRSVRNTGCALLCLLQVLIALTGNYGFFNLLTLALYVSLLDDTTIARLLPWLQAPAGYAQRDAPQRGPAADGGGGAGHGHGAPERADVRPGAAAARAAAGLVEHAARDGGPRCGRSAATVFSA